MQVSLVVFLLVCLAGSLWTLARSRRILEYPGFMTFAFVVFIVPQVVSLIRYPGIVPAAAVDSVLWMSALCLAACHLGYRIRPLPSVYKLATVSCVESRLVAGGAVFMVVALIFGSLIGQMTEDETGGSTWTGKVTIYQFFTGIIFPAMAIFLRLALRKRSLLGWGLFALSLIPPLQSVILAGRREATAQIFLTIGLTLYFERRITPPRLLVPLVAIAAMLIIPATGTYRSIASGKEWENLKQLDLVENFRNFVNRESILELRNAAMLIETTGKQGEYGLGAAYWDEMVWRFIPAQLIGKDLKDSLMIAKGASDDKKEQQEVGQSGYMVPVGSTLTGIGDSFTQFGYLGAGVFALFAILFRTLWAAALRNGAVFGQLLYIGSVTSAMRAVTHQTVDFLPGLTYQLIFIVCLYYWARRSPRNQRARRGRRVSRGIARIRPERNLSNEPG